MYKRTGMIHINEIPTDVAKGMSGILITILLVWSIAGMIAPISAYDLLYTKTLGLGFCDTGGGGSTSVIYVNDFVEFQNTTKIEIFGQGYRHTNLSYTGTTRLNVGPVYYGNATVSWLWNSADSYSSQYTYTVLIHDFNPKTLTGPQTISLSDVPGSVMYPCYVSGSPSINLPSNSVGTILSGSATKTVNGTHNIYSGFQDLIIDFSSNPTTGTAPLDVQFSDTSTPNVATHRLWSFGDGQSENTTAQNTSHTYASAGTYTVRLDTYSSTYGWQNLTKLNYITALSIPISNISFWATNYDPLKSAVVKPSDIKLQNLTSGFWRNVSSTGGTVKFTATDTALTEPITSGQTVKLCGYAPGYGETCANVTIPYSGWEYKINLASTGAVPTGTNATLFVNAIDSYTAVGLAGTTITIANASIPYSKSVLSNDAGIASFVNIDPGTYSISATKTGYQSSVTSWTAPSGLVTNAYIGLLPVGMTPVVTGTGGESLYDDDGNPIIGYDLSGNPITAGPTPDTRTDEEKDSEMMDLLRDQGPMLIQFFIVCFVVYMIMGMAGKR